jgi:hypothetical protein
LKITLQNLATPYGFTREDNVGGTVSDQTMGNMYRVDRFHDKCILRQTLFRASQIPSPFRANRSAPRRVRSSTGKDETSVTCSEIVIEALPKFPIRRLQKTRQLSGSQ